ncbi:MAG: shikimate dehydrogenase [Deltaproteobacteria bacterium]|nr:shikimate dehydrogenase [Deltaproteobacteria bacterium]MBT7202991.1 shikimate dehydrogenase [Deltaproteobacteria bacterium]
MISGYTNLIAHIGWPTGSFKAPMIFNPYFEQEGIDTLVVPMGCKGEDYPGFFKSLFQLQNIIGALITMPHKVSTVAMLDEVSTAVQVCGACNAVRKEADGRLVGDMFDGQGFVRGLARKGRPAQGASALVIGSGGVGSAIAFAMAETGVGRLALYDNRPEVMEQLASRLQQFFPTLPIQLGSNDPSRFEIVVNATPMGMEPGDPLPIEVGRISPTAMVGEVVMKQEETPFVLAARERGCLTQIGTDMLFEQIPAYLEFLRLPTTSAENLRSLSHIRYQ